MKKIIAISLTILVLVGCQSSAPKKVEPIAESANYGPSAAEQGKMAFGQGNYSSAIDYYNEHLTQNPEDASIFFERGRAHNAVGSHDLALRDFEVAISISPNLRFFVYRAGAMVALGKTEDADATFVKVLKSDNFGQLPAYDKFVTYLSHGQLRVDSGNFDLAIAALDEAARIFQLNRDIFQQTDPGAIRAVHAHKARAHFQMEEYAQAAEEMNQYIQLTEKFHGAAESSQYKSLALALYLQRDYENCKVALRRVTPEDRAQLAQAFDDDFFTKD